MGVHKSSSILHGRLDGEANLLTGGVEVGAAPAERAVIGAVAAKVFPDMAALLTSGVVVVDGLGAVRFHSFG
jgi:hypothetical protein